LSRLSPRCPRLPYRSPTQLPDQLVEYRLGTAGYLPAQRANSSGLCKEVWIRDRDTNFVGPFDEVMTSIGARVINTPVRAPRANAFAERFVRTVRIECLDWLLVRNERHLERVLVEFVDHYNEARPHRGIDLEVPAPYTSKALFDDTSRITRVDRLGGLIREYSIAA